MIEHTDLVLNADEELLLVELGGKTAGVIIKQSQRDEYRNDAKGFAERFVTPCVIKLFADLA